MRQYNVTGMSCAACSARIEKAVLKVEGVSACSVSLLTNSMGVEGTAAPEQVIKAVKDAGYGAALKEKEGGNGSSASSMTTDGDIDIKDEETSALKKRLIASLIFLAALMYFSMGHMLWNWPLPGFLQDNHVGMGILQLLLSAAVMVINQKFFISGFKGILHRSPNMDTLVAMGSAVSFLYSTYALFAMSCAQLHGGHAAAAKYMDEFYFETAATILTLITVGKMLEARSKGKTTDALKGLIKLAPKSANVLKDGAEITVSIDRVRKGDIFVVRPGESIPVDGIVIEGNSAVNESALTGESIPVDKGIGDAVSAATLNRSGFLKCEALRVGEDTTLSQIIKLVSDAAATKAPIAKIADRISGIFVPAVIGIAIATFIIWMCVGESVGFSLARAISVLVISCPCALGLATPVAIMVGSGIGAKNAILFKTALSLEETGKLQIVALDKTGTITKGEPKVTDIISLSSVTGEELLSIAYSLESRSEHPLAAAIIGKVQELEAMNKALPAHGEIEDFKAVAGNGLTAKSEGSVLCAGNYGFIQSKADIDEEAKKTATELAKQGKTPIFFSRDKDLIGIIAVADVIKEDSRQAVSELKNMGIHVVMLTGDNGKTARAIGEQAGVDEVIADVLPDGKENVIRNLSKKGKAAMVGDGINDAPALTRADIGIAIGAGADVAIDAADVVLMKSRLSDVPAAIRLSRATRKNIRENLFWAFFYNSLGIPLAAGAFINLFGWKLNPMFGAAAMSLSSFCVVTNALRLNFFNIRNSNRDKKIRGNVFTDNETGREYGKKERKEEKMQKVIKIEGMMCGHCEASVKKALEALDKVESAVVSHESGTATVTLNGEVDDAVLRGAVEAQDYKVMGIS